MFIGEYYSSTRLLLNPRKYLKLAAFLHAKTTDFHSNIVLILTNKYKNIFVESEVNV